MICPWCGATAKEAHRALSYCFECACGGIALGAPPWDFDEVIDDAINVFELRAHSAAVNFVPPQRWLGELGIAFRRGPEVGRNHFFWFKRIAPAAPPDPATQADLDRIWELAGRAWNEPTALPAIVDELRTLRALGVERPAIVEACDHALAMIAGLTSG